MSKMAGADWGEAREKEAPLYTSTEMRREEKRGLDLVCGFFRLPFDSRTAGRLPKPGDESYAATRNQRVALSAESNNVAKRHSLGAFSIQAKSPKPCRSVGTSTRAELGAEERAERLELAAAEWAPAWEARWGAE